MARAKKEFTEAEQKAYAAGLAAAARKGKRSKTGTVKTRSTRRRVGRKAYTERKGKPKRASGCIYYNSYRGKDGSTVNEPKIFAWRYYGSGKNRRKMEMNAFLSKDKGKPQNGTSTDVCLCFVANVKIVGVSKNEYSAVWSQEFEKLTISDLDLVANPKLSGGGYFGPGGPKYRNKVK